MIKTVKQYRQKPSMIYAIEWDGTNTLKVVAFCGGAATHRPDTKQLAIETRQGLVTADVGDFIIQKVGEYYPCKPDVFWETYEETR